MREESIVAFVVAAAGQQPQRDDLLKHCMAHLAPYKVAEHLTVLEVMPEHFLGQVEKKLLRAIACSSFGGECCGPLGMSESKHTDKH